MNGKLGISIFLFLAIFPYFNLSANEIIQLKETTNLESIGNQVYVFEDKTSSYHIQDIVGTKFSQFKKSEQKTPLFGITGSVIWLKFTVQNEFNNDWYLELGNPIIDTVNFYYINADGSIHEEKSGEFIKVSERELENSRFVFHLPLSEKKEKTFYLKLQSINSLQFPLHIVSLKTLIKKNNQQDLYHGIYYGFIVLVIFFSIFILVSTKDVIYVYYILYVICIGLFMSHVNGHAFNYLWAHFGWHRNLTILLASCTAIFAILFAANFLHTKSRHPRLHKGLFVLVVIFIIAFVIHLLGYRILSSNVVLVASFVSTLYVFGLSVYVYLKGYKPAKFFIWAFTVFAVGTIAFILKNMDFLPYNLFTNYAIQIGSGIEITLFSIALADKINMYKKEKEDAQKQALQSQKEIILQLQEKEQLKDKLNKELEQKVQERTHELEEKNRQLDSFVYKASHDIKGPLKSIIGLTTIGMKQIQDKSALEYFDHINKSTLRLDNLLADLLSITKINELKIEKKRIDLNSILNNVLSSFAHAPGYDEMEFKIEVNLKTAEFWSDEKIVYSIIQNMVENAIKYREPSREKSLLEINIGVSEQQASLSFNDNGMGIPTEVLPKIFDMFFKVDESSVGTGLGLYITKTSIQKLGGLINVESEKGVGTRFIIVLPNDK